jgi:hypothetical protein
MFPAGDREPQRAGPSSACHFLELRCIHSAGFLSLKPTMTGHCPSTHTHQLAYRPPGEEAWLQVCNTHNNNTPCQTDFSPFFVPSPEMDSVTSSIRHNSIISPSDVP